MSRVTALIVDDEPLARRKLRDLIRTVEWLECVGEASDGETAVRAIDELQPDLAFLDIRLPRLSGLDLLGRIKHAPAVIFTTAYDRFALSAFELGAADYLLKPFGRERFARAVERVKPALERQVGVPVLDRVRATLPRGLVPRLFVKDGGQIVPLRTSAVERLEASDDFVLVYAGGRRYRINVPLTDLEERLDPAVFVRVHRSHIVNLDQVAGWLPYDGSRFQIRLRNGTVITASRQRSRVLRHLGR